MAIVPIPPLCRFVALSYVWGGTGEGYWTTKANLISRSAPGGLDASILPDTISDTILLVRQLGERYLWIDSLCIVQDDPSDKTVQIGVMDLIYGSSEFTIFAAAGTSRDHLPGVRPGTRDPEQHIAKVQGLQLAIPLPNAKEIITDSTWNERGWTYQEVMLSRRRIFFTAQQVYFECRKELRSEEMLPQPGFAMSGMGMSGLGQIIPKSAHVHLTCESYLRPYMEIVQEFTQRKLTFQSDIVDAVEALLRGLTKAFELADRHYDKAFRFGMLLIGCLDDVLLWQPRANTPHSRRVPTKVMWPSWSWAAWQGAVRYVSDEIYHNNHEGPSLPRFKFGQSLVEWYIVDENGQLVHLYVDHGKGIIPERNPHLATNTAYVAPKGDIDSQQLMTKDVPLVPGTLVFRTSCSRFDVTPWGSEIQNAGAGVSYAIYSILSDIPRSSTRVGRIILPSSTDSPASHEFIVLSRSTERPVRVYDDQRLGESYYGCMLYVMAVQKMQDEKRFERVGVGIIFEQAWVKSSPEEKIIYLG
jgi:hypothetical protein